MGLFGTIKKIGKGIGKVGGKVLGAVGDVGSKVAPALGFIPGVGPVLATGLGAAAGGLGTLNDPGANFGNFLGNAAKGGVKGLAGGLAGGVVKGAIGKGGGLGKILGRATAGGVPGAGGGGGIVGKIGQVGGALLGRAPGQGLSAGDIAQLGIGGLSAIGAGKAAGRSADLQTEALRQAREEYASRSPYRTATSDLLLGRFPSERPDLSSAFAGSSNPFARSLRAPSPNGALPIEREPGGGILGGQLPLDQAPQTPDEARELVRRAVPFAGGFGRREAQAPLLGNVRDAEEARSLVRRRIPFAGRFGRLPAGGVPRPQLPPGRGPVIREDLL